MRTEQDQNFSKKYIFKRISVNFSRFSEAFDKESQTKNSRNYFVSLLCSCRKFLDFLFYSASHIRFILITVTQLSTLCI